jgi:putative transposase
LSILESMPSRNVIKQYLIDGWYHLYNRGINRQEIFLDDQDYSYFLSLCKKYLSPEAKIDPLTGLINPTNLSDLVKLSCFILMPNHFHLLIKQSLENGITQLTQRIITSYVVYYNHKYSRSGPLFEGKLKGINIDNDAYLLHLSRYIHRNALSLPCHSINYEYSSYAYFIGRKHAVWINSQPILDYFYLHKVRPAAGRTFNNNLSDAIATYREFVEYENEESDNQIDGLTLE